MIFRPEKSSERIIIQPDAMGKWDKNAADVDSRPSELTAASSHICWASLHQTGHMRWRCGDIITAVNVCREAIQLKKKPKAKRLWYSQSKKDERKKKREDERLVFSKPRWFVMLEVWNISLRPPAALQDCELLQHKPACSSSPPLWGTVETSTFCTFN